MLLFVRGKFSFLYVDIWSDVTKCTFFVKKRQFWNVGCVLAYFCGGHKFFSNSSILSVIYLSWDSNLSKSGTSRPSEEIRKGLYFNDFSFPNSITFLFNEEINILRYFTRNMTNCFRSCEILLLGFYRIWTRIMRYRLEIAPYFR